MPTTTASKSGLRANASAKRTKAAQRTPLPTKDHAENIELAREAVAEVKAAKSTRRAATPAEVFMGAKNGVMVEPEAVAVPKQRAPRKARGGPISNANGPDGFIAANAEAKAASAERTALAAKALTVRPDKAKAEHVKPTKADKYAAEFSKLGWAPEITRQDGLVELVATREGEALYLAWMNEAHVSGTSTYTIADRTVKVRNPAEAMRIAALQPAEAQAKQAKVSSNKQFRRRATGPTIRSVPFDFRTATDDQIISAIEARRISWHNAYAVTTETATVGTAKCITIKDHPDGHRIVSFVDPENGYRAFRLDRLENVGRRVDLARIRQQIIASLSRMARAEDKKNKSAS
jgi:hypothetical protein